jgi:uncharacterized protein YutE (UPF0331/DUF86 family)
MTSNKANQKIIVDRLAWINRMLADIRSLPLDGFENFQNDSRNIGAAESSLRRALEALLDLGRHILAKVFAKAVAEYNTIADELEKEGVLDSETGRQLKILAGYRNRMVHFYHEITPEELFDICSNQIDDIVKVQNAFKKWIKDNPEFIDRTI